MDINFDQCLSFVLEDEGGFVNDPRDPGGATNKGITLATLAAYRGSPVTPNDVQKLTTVEAGAIYRVNYWNAARCDALPNGVDYVHFTIAVMAGPARAGKILQQALGFKGADVDGVVGIKTLAAINAVDAHETPDLINTLCTDFLTFLKSLKTYSVFGNGWSKRIMGDAEGVQTNDIGVVDRATRMALGAVSIPAPPERQPGDVSGKAHEADVKITAQVIDLVKNPASAGAVGTILTAVLTAGASPGPIGYAVSASLVGTAFVLLLRAIRPVQRSA